MQSFLLPVFTAFAILTAAGCGSTTSSVDAAPTLQEAPPASRAETRAPSPRAQKPRASAYLHRASGWSFPRSSGDLERQSARSLSDDGRELAVGYRGPGVGVTWFVLPSDTLAGGDYERHFQESVLSVQEVYQQVSVLGAGPSDMTIRGEEVRAFVAIFEYTQEGRGLNSVLMVFPAGSYVVKIRMTHVQADSSDDIEYFVGQLGQLVQHVDWFPVR